MTDTDFSRRDFLTRTGSAGIALAMAGAVNGLAGVLKGAEPVSADGADLVQSIRDPLIREGVKAAIEKNLVPAAKETAYPGHFLITADGRAYGGDSTWPGLDSWQMCGAYLPLGRTRMVLDYFDFVRAAQRKDGNVPFAVFPEMQANDTCLRGLKYPDDVFEYVPPKRDGLPESSQKTRRWIGLFEHWQNLGDPLTTLGPICYILTAAEIFAATRSVEWMRERIASVEAAGKHLLSRRSDNGLIGGSGFYTESPPRYAWDGVTQCYAIHAFRALDGLLANTEPKPSDAAWSRHADRLVESFAKAFWRDDHFGEYVHPEHGLVDSHGLSDVNWAAVAFDIATADQRKVLWPRLTGEKGFWPGDVPTQTVTKPFAYAEWEINRQPPCPAPPLNDVAAMGRAWSLEAAACRRMKDHSRLVESVRKVCKMGLPAGNWRERYHPQPDGSVKPARAEWYCEYPAVLVRVVLGNLELFAK
ncbi:MAG: hypothetical protein L0228_13810 [Planctomycetes bacterium]|nr:hypothetical protein [Planctomycetota bacterium]